MTFAFPEASYLFIALFVILALFLSLQAFRKKQREKFADAQSLTILLSKQPRWKNLTHCFLLLFIWSCACLALMQPRANPRFLPQGDDESSSLILNELVTESDEEKESLVKRFQAHDVIFLVDTSASMDVRDMRNGGSRLDYAKEIIDETTSLLKGPTVSLFAFTSQLTPLVPSTSDYLFLRMLLRRMNINEGDVAGTDLVEALESLKRQYKKFNKNSQRKTLILLTDGGDTRIERLNGAEREQEIRTLLSRLGNVDEAQLQVFTVGLGTKEGALIPNLTFNGEAISSTLDESLLKQLSDKGKGDYYFANAYSTLAIAQDLSKKIHANRVMEEEKVTLDQVEVERLVLDEHSPEPIYDLYYQMPLFLALVALAIDSLYLSPRRGSV